MAQATISLSPILPPRYPGIVKAVANHLARRAVERQLQAQGIRLTTFPYARVVAQAQVYLAEHEEELFARAMERVRASAWHSMMAEREESRAPGAVPLRGSVSASSAEPSQQRRAGVTVGPRAGPKLGLVSTQEKRPPWRP